MSQARSERAEVGQTLGATGPGLELALLREVDADKADLDLVVRRQPGHVPANPSDVAGGGLDPADERGPRDSPPSRLESGVARPGSVVIGEQTRESVGDEFELESLGTFSLKGKEKEVLAYEVRSAAKRGPDTIPPVEPEAPGGASGP